MIPEGKRICPACEFQSRHKKTAMGYGQQKPFGAIRLVIRWWLLSCLLKNTNKKSQKTKEETNG